MSAKVADNDWFKDTEWTEEELQVEVEEDEMDAGDAGFLYGAEGDYSE